MWHEINNNNDLADFMNTICSFHDSCIKEMKYFSGAYVDDDLSMYPVNDVRALTVIVHRQYQENSMIEMEFKGLKCLQLLPCDDNYTCEILDSTMLLKDGCIYWFDCGTLPEMDFDNYKGNMISALKLRWRSIDNCMGQKEFYTSIV